MDEETKRVVGNGLLVLGLLCFVGGAVLLGQGTPVGPTTYALGALGLLFVGVGASLTNRG